MKKRTKIVSAMAALVIIAGLAFAFRPKPVEIQAASVTSGPLQETVDEEGKTRMHDHFVLASTVAGKLRRVELHAGDPVRAGQVVGWVDPTPIEPRQTAVLQARLEAAQATQSQADADVGRTQAENDQAATELERTRKLFEQGIASRESYDKIVNAAAAARKQLDSARSRARAAAYQVEEARAELLSRPSHNSSLPVSIKSPVAGHVLRLIEQSERVLPAGAPIVEIGYTPRLEVVADFLTRDAVRISPQMNATIDDWGGDIPLRARVRVVEPGAFTKVSALGVEEQRVNVLLDFVDGSDRLADAYRVEVRVVVWESNNAVKVPSSALSRVGENWSVFKIWGGKAHQTAVKIGHRGSLETEILDGLNPGDMVIVHPSSEINDGVRVRIPHPSA